MIDGPEKDLMKIGSRRRRPPELDKAHHTGRPRGINHF